MQIKSPTNWIAVAIQKHQQDKMPSECYKDNWEAKQLNLPPIAEALNEYQSQFPAITCPFSKFLHILYSQRERCRRVQSWVRYTDKDG